MKEDTSPPEPAPAVEQIGPYRFECHLGSGGMACVFQAYDTRLKRRVAIKHVRRTLGNDEQRQRRLETEARAIASLRHSSIVQVFDVLSTNAGKWIVMELVDGPSVADLLDGGPLAFHDVVSLGLDVIHGLQEAHRHGVLHRDLKAENVMVDSSGTAKILDFGLAKCTLDQDEPTITCEGGVLGTARIMSPEQANGEDVDERSDLFAFGVLLYEMATGRSPFRAPTPVATIMKATRTPHRDVRDYQPDLPQPLVDLIDRLLAKDREERPANADKVAATMEQILVDLSGNSASLQLRLHKARRLREGSKTPRPGTAGSPGHSADHSSGSSWDSSSGDPSENLSTARTSLFPRQADASPTRPFRKSGSWSGELPDLGSSWKLLASAAGLGVAAARLLPALGRKERSNGSTRDARVMVLPFANHGPKERRHFTAGLTSELIGELSRSSGIKVVSHRTSKSNGTRDRSLAEIGAELGLSHAVVGDVSWAAESSAESSKDAMRAGIQLIRVSDGEVLYSTSTQSSAEDILRVQKDLADDMSREIEQRILVDVHGPSEVLQAA